MKAEQIKRDKFTIIYALWAGALFLFYAWADYSDRIPHLLFVPLLLLPTIVVAVALLASLIGNAFKGRWRRCISAIVGPCVAASIFVLGYLGIDRDRIHFDLTKSYYIQQIAQMPRVEDEPLFARFDWGSRGGVGVANIFYSLVFDESDEVALPHDQRSEQWKRRVGGQMYSILHPGARHSIDVRKIEGHFYLVTEVHQ
jgi:hypothetical protein